MSNWGPGPVLQTSACVESLVFDPSALVHDHSGHNKVEAFICPGNIEPNQSICVTYERLLITPLRFTPIKGS